MSKRVGTKERKEAEQKTRLKQRLKDLAIGAIGGYILPAFEGDEFNGMVPVMGMDAFGRWIGAIENALLTEERHKDLTAACYLEHYDSIDEAAEMLWKHGVRP